MPPGVVPCEPRAAARGALALMLATLDPAREQTQSLEEL